MGAKAPVDLCLKLKLLVLLEAILHGILAFNCVLNADVTALIATEGQVPLGLGPMLFDIFKAHVRAINQAQNPSAIRNDCGKNCGCIHLYAPSKGPKPRGFIWMESL
jgi:hypothetical protein